MKGIRIGICVLLTFAVLAHGAVEPWSEAVLEVGAAVLLAVWGLLFALGLITGLRWNHLLTPLAGLWVWVVAQYLTRYTANPFLTRVEIMRFSALAILLFLAVQAFETLEHWQGFVWFVLVLGFAVSLFGIIQHFTFNGKLYWVRELRYGGIPFGPYVNRNHFAGLVELVAPLGLATLLLRAEQRDRVPLIGILTLVPIGALFMAASLAGIICFLLELGLLMILIFLRRRGQTHVMAAAIMVLLAGAFVAWLGVGPALDRFTTYRKLEVSEQRRTEMFYDTWHIFKDHPLLGTGFGTLQAVFPRYETLYDGNVVLHSHDDYLEALAETGLVGGIFWASFLIVLFRDAWKRLRAATDSLDLAFHIGALSACCGILAHSWVDFNMHIPSNALLFLLLAGLATSQVRIERPPAPKRARYTANSAVAIHTEPV